MNAFQALFCSASLLPHGFCYLWNPLLIWLHGVSDTLIAGAYFSIPPTLIYLVRKKKSIPFDWMFVCFGCFIAACGATHLMEVVTLWTPVYWISGGVKVITAFASVPTAILLARVVPQILEMPTAEEMRVANEELKLQARVLREQAALLDLSQDAILVQAINGEILLWNQVAERVYGWTKAEAIGKNSHELLRTSFSPPLDEIMLKLVNAGHWEGELQKKRRDRETLIVSSHWALGRDAAGCPEKVLVIDTDVTEQRRAEAALRESEDRYRDLVEHSLDLICTHDLEGRLLTVNELPAKILGYSREELIQKPMKDFLLKEGHASFDEYLKDIQTTKVAEGVMVVLTKGGEHRVWEYHNSLRTDGVNVPVVRGVAHDVTEQRLAERALRQSEEKFRLMAENIDEVFWLLDPKSLGAIYVSPAFEHICERPVSSLLSDPISYRDLIHPDDAPHVLKELARLEKTHEFHEQFRILCSSRLKWIEVWGFTAKILIVTMHESNQMVRRVLEMGARGYVLKSDMAAHLFQAVKDLANGKISLTPKVSAMVLEGFLKGAESKRAENGHAHPTPREVEIIRLLAEGKSNKEIAAELGITLRTVETHRAHIMMKMGLHSLPELIHYAIRDKIITTQDL